MDATTSPAADRTRSGLALGVGAYGLWGLLPIYFKLLIGVPAVAIVAHRIVWSLLVLGILLSLGKAWREVGAALRHKGSVKLLLATSLLIGTNWLIYVYAVNSGHILAGSLGYYLNPLANILLGRFVLREPLSRPQWLAVAIAGVGVSILAVGALSHLWISLALCFSFSLYGLLRKIAHVDATAGLAIETLLLFVPAAVWLAWASARPLPVWGLDSTDTWLLVFSGVASTIPLLLFTAAARRLPYSTLGILQFIAPTLQFLVAVFLYGEPFTSAHAWAFACIWTAAIIYLLSALRGSPSNAAAPE
ncbi:EamA family transporter RarD [Sphingomonas astaxanthinifaciens]|uniref:Transporter n=1 Tax=Sphingomonas astaxanthinifaciens DSM 22298 TaxID=1123267 RepID=A0ABQ5Z977_9SPHN|nr:EamA family transporter RarD [Sphingomonas astaxanthinifaciens]GLR47137.1 putative transporter [Sphingomonas astaxanthinifaciens DSM 22298]